MAEGELFERGLQRRREVLGSDYVDANLRDSDEFMMALQRAVTEVAWGWAWSRPGLDAKTRSMINLALLTALGRFDELGIYVKGALRSGVTVPEIQEVLLHAIAAVLLQPGWPPPRALSEYSGPWTRVRMRGVAGVRFFRVVRC